MIGGAALVTSSGPVTVNPLLQKTPYDVDRDFVPVAMIGLSPYVLVTGTAFPATNARDIVALLKANPGKYTFASSGTGATAHLVAEWFNMRAGLSATHVPYKGEAPALNDVAAGVVDYMLASQGAKAYVDAGRLRPLPQPAHLDPRHPARRPGPASRCRSARPGAPRAGRHTRACPLSPLRIDLGRWCPRRALRVLVAGDSDRAR